MEKEPRTKKEKEDLAKERKQKGKFSIFGIEVTLGKKTKINLDAAHHLPSKFKICVLRL
ncbi:hypothetical protein [Acetivibrio straminisolvens]|uniref:Integral membrane protein n=1 Tax=Acetivibrio straminisolvens JCM 21531 TaxID=1294263 RepID=W4V1N3_9FIRM|nr:hypothetical protein [Acetivibrio straminisolvens]GAE87002.1 integral membrane protein [Acetivibrio straminisolvens JCM 21531]